MDAYYHKPFQLSTKRKRLRRAAFWGHCRPPPFGIAAKLQLELHTEHVFENVFGATTGQVKRIVSAEVNGDVLGEPYINSYFGSSNPLQCGITIDGTGASADININWDVLSQVETKHADIGIPSCRSDRASTL